MAKKVILKDLNDIEVLPITRGELVLDASGNPALHSTLFLATDSLPGLMSSEDKYKLDHLEESGPGANNKVAQINTTTNDVYRLLFSETADDTDRTEKSRKSANLTFNPSTGVLNLIGAINANSGTLNDAIYFNDSKKYIRYNSGSYLEIFNETNSYSGLGLYDDGSVKVYTNSKWNAIIHSGNIGSQIVEGLFAGSTIGDANTVSFTDKALRWFSGIPSDTSNIPIYTGWQNGLIALPLHSNGITAQLYFSYSKKLYYRSSQTLAWNEIAYITDNVASATKLENKVKIWGLDFDGSSDVSGYVKGTYFTIGDRNNAYIELLSGTYYGYIQMLSDGSIAMGPNSPKSIIVDQNGNVSIGGLTTISSALSVTGTGTFNNQIISNVADGTAPLTVISTTKVANLNADKLDGYDSTDIMRIGTWSTVDNQSGNLIIPFLGKANPINSSEHIYGSVLQWTAYLNSTPGVSNTSWYYLLWGVTSHDHLYFRKRTNTGSWSTVQALAFTSDIPTVTDYYWANIKISKDSSTTTNPTFGNASIKGGDDTGLNLYTSAAYTRIRFYNASSVNNATIHYFGTAYSGYDFVKDSLNLGCLGLVTLGGWNNPTLVVSSNTTTSNSDGKVGISTTSPSYNLSVGSSICANFNTNGSRVLLEPAAGGVTGGGIAFWGFSGWHNGTINASVLVLNNASGGNVGIGTTSPSAKLHVNGNIFLNNHLYFTDSAASVIKYGQHTTTALGSYPLPSLGSNGLGLYVRPSKSIDEGGVIITEDTCMIFNSADSGWSFQVHNTDLSQKDFSGTNGDGTKSRVFGIVDSGNYAWSRGGFLKNGSSDSYVLLGGGGHKLESNLSVASANRATTANMISHSTYYYSGNVMKNSTSAGTIFGESATANYLFPSFMEAHPTWGNYADVINFTGYCKWGGTQLATEYNAINPRVAIRKFNQSRSNWGDWTEFITEKNNYKVRDSGNSNEITFYYSTGGLTSNPSWLAAWNGYKLTYVSPSVLNVNYATNSTYLYSCDSTYKYGGSNPYYMKMRYNTNGDYRWYLSVYPETPKTVAVDYAYSAGNADTVDNKHASDFAAADRGVYPIRTFTKTLAPTTSWTDTGITTANFTDGEGAYLIFLDPNHSNGNDGWVPKYMGYFASMSGTNGAESEEIILLAASHASYKRLFLRFINTGHTLGYRKLQIKSLSNYTASYSMIFKIRRII